MSQLTSDKTNSKNSSACDTCSVYHAAQLKKMGLRIDNTDFTIALAGNPNTGKSTIFNSLTGLKQHTGNWPGKTVSRAEGSFVYADNSFKIVDLPGTYSLLSTSTDEDVARNFILFGQPEVTVIVIEACQMERNLNLVLQILEISKKAVLCINLMDEAERKGVSVDFRAFSRILGIPVVGTSARFGKGIDKLLEAIHEVATGKYETSHHKNIKLSDQVLENINFIEKKLEKYYPELGNKQWLALRLLDQDEDIIKAFKTGEISLMYEEQRTVLKSKSSDVGNRLSEDLTDDKNGIEFLSEIEKIVSKVDEQFHDKLTEDLFASASNISKQVIIRDGKREKRSLEDKLDGVLTSKLWGFPVMFGILMLVFWLTIEGANYPSGMLATLLVEKLHPILKGFFDFLPLWLNGLLIDGIYLTTAWVISVMLPPMMIFFPVFTILEDFGYLPRVSFNLDRLFRKAGGHGKQALSMTMGFGCNAAGVVATRVIDSPRERLIAIITNNFALCNGRWPTQILLATLFIGSLVPTYLAGIISSLAVVSIALLGVFLTLVCSWGLSKTVLKGEASAFSLELPPYRPPRILQTIYTSLVDRTLLVLWRAVLFAIPAGAAIWLVTNIDYAGLPLANHIVSFLDPMAYFMGLNGVILLAYIIAIPANEVVIPSILMLTVLVTGIDLGEGTNILFETDSHEVLRQIFSKGGWTVLTAINLMLFSLLHNPCSTTIYTIYKETGSVKWTTIATILPLVLGFIITILITQISNIF